MRVFVSNKIKKGYKKIELKPLSYGSDLFDENSWNAHYVVFYGKKCWVLTHSDTRYTVIVPDVSAGKIADFRSLFLNSLIAQLAFLGTVNDELVDQFIGELEFYPTNGDRSCISNLNKRIFEISLWKDDTSCLSDFNFAKIAKGINHLCSKTINGKSCHIWPNEDFVNLLNGKGESRS